MMLAEYEYQVYNNDTGEILKSGRVKHNNRANAVGMARAMAMSEGINFLSGDIRVRLLSLDPLAAELTIEKLMRDHHITQTQLSKRFGIPYKTIQNWKAVGKERRQCPDYVLRMMNEILSNEKKEEEEMKSSDGWHEVYGRKVYVENGKVIRGLSTDGQRTVWPYEGTNSGGLNNVSGKLTLAALRARTDRGTISWN